MQIESVLLWLKANKSIFKVDHLEINKFSFEDRNLNAEFGKPVKQKPVSQFLITFLC